MPPSPIFCSSSYRLLRIFCCIVFHHRHHARCAQHRPDKGEFVGATPTSPALFTIGTMRGAHSTGQTKGNSWGIAPQPHSLGCAHAAAQLKNRAFEQALIMTEKPTKKFSCKHMPHRCARLDIGR